MKWLGVGVEVEGRAVEVALGWRRGGRRKAGNFRASGIAGELVCEKKPRKRTDARSRNLLREVVGLA